MVSRIHGVGNGGLSCGKVALYHGPLIESMDNVNGFELDQLGLLLTISKSTVGEGLGLFVSLLEDAEESVVSKGTVLCGYSRGTFTAKAEGDKAVAFSLTDLNATVIYNKEIMPLEDAVASSQRELGTTTRLQIPGHTLSMLENGALSILPDLQHYDWRHFIPHSTDEVTIMNVGMLANDAAYSSGVTNREEYQALSDAKNILSLVWRLELNDRWLRPTWPVVVFNRDLIFHNQHPMEVGLHYSWQYWDSMRRQRPNM